MRRMYIMDFSPILQHYILQMTSSNEGLLGLQTRGIHLYCLKLQANIIGSREKHVKTGDPVRISCQLRHAHLCNVDSYQTSFTLKDQFALSSLEF